MVRWRGRGNTRVSKVKKHADGGLVTQGTVREKDRIGNNEADAAADLGRRRVHYTITDARRPVNVLLRVGIESFRSFTVFSLHRQRQDGAQ